MISKLLQLLEQGLRVMRSNTHVLLVGVLVFVFPLLFIWVTQTFFTAAYENIHTAEKQRVGMMHDTLSVTLTSGTTSSQQLNKVAQSLQKRNVDFIKLLKLRVYKETPNGWLVIAAANPEAVNTYDAEAAAILNISLPANTNSVTIEKMRDGKRLWHTYSHILVNNESYYIFSEEDFSQIDNRITQRQQHSYLVLTIIFAFLILLAYWVHRQTDWKKKFEKLQGELHERDLFSNMIAHEFRAPLTAIKGYASFLEESADVPTEERRYASNIKQSAEHLVALVSDFLEVARIQSGKLKMEKREVDIRKVLELATENLQGMATEKGLKLIYTTTAKPIMVQTDDSRLLQVLTNVITNAIKYTETGSVELKCEEGYKKVTIRVMDTGMGISAEDQKKLFAPFTRVGGVDNTQITGTGLGMYITKQLVALLGGTVGVESIKGVGSHIVITLQDE